MHIINLVPKLVHTWYLMLSMINLFSIPTLQLKWRPHQPWRIHSKWTILDDMLNVDNFSLLILNVEVETGTL